MASIYSSATLHSRSISRNYTSACQSRNAKPGNISSPSDRRQFIFLTSGAASTFALGQLTVRAEDIGFFGIRKKVKEAEKKAEGTVDKGGVEESEKRGESAQKRADTAQEEIKSSDSFGAVVQAGAVAGAEVLGVLVATSFVKRILESEA